MKYFWILSIVLLTLNCTKNKSDPVAPCISVSPKIINQNDSIRIINCNDYNLSISFNSESTEYSLNSHDTLYRKFNSTGTQTIYYLQSKAMAVISRNAITIEVE